MKEAIRRSFDRVKLSEVDKKRVMDEILNKSEATRHSHSIRWIAGGAAALVAAAVLAVVLLGQKPGALQAAASETPATISGVASATEVSSPQSDFVCSIVLSINPSVEFRLGDDDMVVEVAGLNEDGVALIEGIDFAGLSLENATIVVVNKLIEQGYISASMVDDVYISVTGSTQPDTLEMMSTIIKTAASQYELAVDTVQTGESELQVVLGDTDTTTPEITPTPDTSLPPDSTPTISPLPTPPADVSILPAALTLQYLKDSHGGVDNVLIDFGGQRVDSDIDAYIDIAGKPVMMATFQALNKLIGDGYLTDEHPDTKAEFDVSAFGEETAAQVRELAALMAQEAGLALAAVDEGGGRFCLAASGLPAPERTARYTLREIDDPTLIKAREDITALQMQILEMSFTAEEIDHMLTPRYWAVMPDLIGLDESRAAELLTLAGIQPIPSYEDGEHTQDVDYGQVFYQDYPAGSLIEVGSRLYFHVRAHSMPTIGTQNLTPELLQYLPTFLDDTGHATVTVDRTTGMGVPISFRQAGYDVVIHAFGGGWKNADGSPRWNEQHIATNPDEISVYWAADNGDGDDVPMHANLVYEIYRDGEYVASVAVNLTLISSIEDDTLTYEASVIAFGEDGPYSYLDF